MSKQVVGWSGSRRRLDLVALLHQAVLLGVCSENTEEAEWRDSSVSMRFGRLCSSGVTSAIPMAHAHYPCEHTHTVNIQMKQHCLCVLTSVLILAPLTADQKHRSQYFRTDILILRLFWLKHIFFQVSKDQGGCFGFLCCVRETFVSGSSVFLLIL